MIEIKINDLKEVKNKLKWKILYKNKYVIISRFGALKRVKIKGSAADNFTTSLEHVFTMKKKNSEAALLKLREVYASKDFDKILFVDYLKLTQVEIEQSIEEFKNADIEKYGFQTNVLTDK